MNVVTPLGEDKGTAFPAARIAWTAVAVLTAIGAVGFVDRQVLALLVEPLKKDLGLTDTQIGVLQGFSFVILYATAGVPLGFAVDRYSRRLIIFLGVVAWSAATVLSGLSHSYNELLLARICVGLGEAALGPAAYSMLNPTPPEAIWSRMMSSDTPGVAISADGGTVLVGGFGDDADTGAAWVFTSEGGSWQKADLRGGRVQTLSNA